MSYQCQPLPLFGSLLTYILGSQSSKIDAEGVGNGAAVGDAVELGVHRVTFKLRASLFRLWVYWSKSLCLIPQGLKVD